MVTMKMMDNITFIYQPTITFVRKTSAKCSCVYIL